ncbi:MAG: SRPBCC domain-containing protein, partial [Chitinophagaceae bacterium]
GRMEEGKQLIWRFPEYDMEFPVRTGKMVPDQLISFYWEIEGKELLVEIKLAASGSNATVVRITEGSMENNEAGINWLRGNTEGWANFLACLKAWLEYGVHLRKGAFDFPREKPPATADKQ